MNRIDVLLADDHQLVRAGLRLLIESEEDLHVVGEAADGAIAWDMIGQLRPHVAVVDLSMPVMSGIELVSRLHVVSNGPRVLALTANEEPGYVRLLSQMGAAGYLLKRSAAEELILAIRRVARGERYFGAKVVDLVVEHLPAPAIPEFEGAMPPLSDRERNVLRMIAEGLTNKEIAARLDISIKTVETYKARGMQKLKLRGRTDIVRYAMTLGWLNVS